MANTRTVLDAGLALKKHGSLVKGLTPKNGTFFYTVSFFQPTLTSMLFVSFETLPLPQSILLQPIEDAWLFGERTDALAGLG